MLPKSKPKDDSGSFRFAISGSTGLIGSALSRRLIENGHAVHPLVRPGSKPDGDAVQAQPGDAIEWVPAVGMTNPSQLNHVDVLIHLAGRSIASGRWTSEEKRRIRDSRVLATSRLVDQILGLDAPPKVVVSASATGIYGDCGDSLVDENAAQARDFLADIAKDWESACDPLRAAGIRVVHPRFGIVLDKHGGALAKMLPLFRSGLGGRLGGGKQYWSWIGLQDCVSAIDFLWQNPDAEGAYNLVAPESVTNARFTTLLGRVLHRPVFLSVPSFVLCLALGEMANALLLTSCRVQPKRLSDAGFKFQFPTLERFFDNCFESNRMASVPAG